MVLDNKDLNLYGESRSGEKIQETGLYREGMATVTIDIEKIRSDFLDELIRRANVDRVKAQELAKKLQIFTNRNNYIDYCIKDYTSSENPTPLWRLAGKLASIYEVILQGKPIASAHFSEKLPAVFFDVENIIKYYDSINTSEEIRQAAVIQGFYICWEHEKEHLVDYLNDDFKDRKIKQDRFRAITQIVGSELLLIGSTVLFPHHPTGSLIAEAARLSVVFAASVGMSHVVVNEFWYRFMSDFERRARETSKRVETGKRLFSLLFEKTRDNFPKYDS